MIVFDLACEHAHRFEAWFSSADAYQAQRQRALISCPVCASCRVERMPSSTRVNLSRVRSNASSHDGKSVDVARNQGEMVPMANAAWLRAVRALLSSADNVGERFADEVRRIHDGELPPRNIRGFVTLEEAQSLLEEGIDVLPLPNLPFTDGPLH
ncbi:MAG TPA: DUF1178 family protein [Burkholderiaceae bacterium]|nr:DUF1178 family protein [Burkholderiaceae bacterium]